MITPANTMAAATAMHAQLTAAAGRIEWATPLCHRMTWATSWRSGQSHCRGERSSSATPITIRGEVVPWFAPHTATLLRPGLSCSARTGSKACPPLGPRAPRAPTATHRFCSTLLLVGLTWSSSADKHAVPHPDAVHAIANAVYHETQFDDPRLPSGIRPTCSSARNATPPHHCSK